MLRALLLLAALQAAGDDAAKALRLVSDPAAPLLDRENAVKALARTAGGGRSLLGLHDQGRLPDELRATAAFALAASPDPAVRAEADRKIPPPKSKEGTPLPPIARLLEMKGDAVNGAKVYRRPEGPNCIACHQIGDEGRMVGPPLTTIANKLAKELMLEALVTPSAAILMSYENYAVRLKNGDVKTGIKVEDTDDHITLKDGQGEFIDIPKPRIEEIKQLRLSMMPEDLLKSMTVQELVDLLEYLGQQK